MRRQQDETVGTDYAARHRRGGVRHAVALQALMEHPTGEKVPCRIVDVSSTGMGLEIGDALVGAEHASFAPGTKPTIRFLPGKGSDTTQTVEASCAIMWMGRRHFGVRFESPDAALRAALKAVVHAEMDARKEEGSGSADGMDARQRAILKACRQTLQKQIPNLVWVLRSALEQRLRAGAAGKRADAAQCADDAALLESKAMAIGLSAEHRFLSSFADCFRLQRTQELTVSQIREAMREAEGRAERAAQLQATGGTDPLFQRVVQDARERYGERFRTLDLWMAQVCDQDLDDPANPLAPATACHILWESIVEQSASTPVRQALEAVMLKQVMPLLADLYDALERTLDAQGVNAGRN